MIIRTASSADAFDIDWGSIAVVFIVAMIASVGIVSVFSLGLRLLATGEPGARPVPATLGAYACIGVGALAVLYGIYLVVPQFHLS